MERIIFMFLLFTGGSLPTAISAENGEYHNPPRIIPDKPDITVPVGGNITLRCEGNKPLTWDLPKNSEVDNMEMANMIISVSETPDTLFPYGLLLEIFNVSAIDVGYYTCHFNETDIKDQFSNQEMEAIGLAKRLYLFVNDPETPLVPMEAIVSGVVFDSITIPCRPTSLNANVTLMIDDVEVIPNKSTVWLDNRSVSYDMYSGYTLPNAAIEDGNRNYNCSGHEKFSSHSLLFILSLIHPTTNVPKPTITDSTNGKVSMGGEIKLDCTVQVDIGVPYILYWTYPDKSRKLGIDINITNTSVQTMTLSNGNQKSVGKTSLSLKDANSSDEGHYVCTVRDASSNEKRDKKLVSVYEHNTSFIKLFEPTNISSIDLNSGKPLRYIVTIDAFPAPKITWYDNNNKEIEAGWSDIHLKKYTIKTDGKTSQLTINRVTLSDTGIYRVNANNGFESKSLNLTLVVREKPSIKLESGEYYMFDTRASILCTIKGFPRSTIGWEFQPCNTIDCKSNSSSIRNLQKFEYTEEHIDNITTKSIASLVVNTSGYLRCFAKNNLGNDSVTTPMYATDIEDGFGFIESIDYVAVGEDLNVTCAASIHKSTGTIKWYNIINDTETLLNESVDEGIQINHHETKYSHQSTLHIAKVKKELGGKYICKLEEEDGNILTEVLQLIVKDTEVPVIYSTNMNSSESLYLLAEQNHFIFCKSRGIPFPVTKWYKDGKELHIPTNDTRIELTEKGTHLKINTIKEGDQGVYQCKSSNKVGTASREVEIVLLTKEFKTGYIIFIICLVVVFIVLIGILVYKIKKEKEIRKELQIAGLLHFEEGATESLNPDLGVDDQAELLPYEKKWEFPREKLKLGKQLGSGAFGVVMKAVAQGISREEDSTTVAVKMVKRSADAAFIKALASELKIMVHLGKHLNVVNLLGACTKNVSKRELYVIVEYCRFGNLHNYLLRHRDCYIDQINPKNGNIDTTIGSEAINRAYSVSSSRSSALKSATQPLLRRSSSRDSTGNVELDTTTTAVSMAPNGDDIPITSSGSQQPEWRSNYRGDYNYSREVRPISTQDLICWAFQIARGMEYLANRKVMHGDLAARNILLADDNIVKICDFGLAKSMYKCDNYKKKGDGPLPVKWMAVESIRDRIFSTQSDIWSFGIVLWELFSLAKTPYPGIEADEKFYISLIEGYRMDKPPYANERIYKIMSECWLAKPIQRPTFTELAEKFGVMLEEGVRKYYIDLNDPYMQMNNAWMIERGDNDYLAMMSSPDYSNFTSTRPEYVNEPFGGSSRVNRLSPEDTDAEGYLRMSPASNNTIANKNSDIFVFDPVKKKISESLDEEKSNNLSMKDLISMNNLPHSPNINSPNIGSNPTSPNFNSTPTSPAGSGVSNQTYKATYPLTNNKCDLMTNDVYLDMSPKTNGFGGNGIINESTTGFSNPSYVTMHPNNTKTFTNHYNNIPTNIVI